MEQKKHEPGDQLPNNTIDKNHIHYLVTDGGEKMSRMRPRVAGIYYWWDILLLQRKILWIVGPRKPSMYGEKVLRHLFSTLPLYDVVTISWWAQWIDYLVHQLSLERNIPTIVVLGWSITWYQQTGQCHFLQRIVDKGGLVISEYADSMAPRKYTFPQRNRIIAWLSDSIFVPEASVWSGSLITVERAGDYSVPVYAPMQDIFSVSGMWVTEYMIQGKINSVWADMSTFLSHYYTKKSWEMKLLTVDHMPQSSFLWWKTHISSSSSSVEW
jgi:DNA protecting protein DprA